MNRYFYSFLKDIYIIVLFISCMLKLLKKANLILLAVVDGIVLILIFTFFEPSDLWFVIGCGIISHLEAFFYRK